MRTFWFAPESPRPVALMRIGLGLVLLYDAALRWPYAIELYSSAGLPIPVFPYEGTGRAGLEPVALGPAATVGLHTLLLFFLAAVVVGWQTRFSLSLAAGLGLWLGLLDQAGTFKKYSVIGTHLLLLLWLTQCGGIWSVDALFGRGGRWRAVRLGAAWPRRLMQLLVVSIYLGAAVTKIRLPDFANGDLLMFSLLDDQWGGSTLGLSLSTQPNLLILASIGTVFLEIAFPLLVWNRALRRPMLVLAALFHIVLWMTMHLGIFSPMMLVALLAFVREEDLSACTRPLVRARSAWTVDADEAANRPASVAETLRLGRLRLLKNVGAYALMALLAAVSGVAVQYRIDAYGVFRGRESAEFAPFDPEQMIEVLAEQTPADAGHYGDYFHRLEIGSRLSSDGTHTFGRRRRFRPGMTVYACTRLIQRHPTMRLQWVLTRPDGREAVHSHTLDRSASHATVGFALTDPEQTPAGRYRLTLKADGSTVAARSFELLER